MLLWKMKTLSKQRAPCGAGAVRAGVVCWPWWPRPGRSRVALRGVRRVAQRCGGWAVFGPACLQWASRQWSALRHSPFRPSDVSHWSVEISLFRFVVRTFVGSTLSRGSVPRSSPPSPLCTGGRWNQCDLCFCVFVEREEQSWAVLFCAGETFGRVFTQAQGLVGCAESCALLRGPCPCRYSCGGSRVQRM